MTSGVQTVTLTEFLLARIAEDEEVARGATPGVWKLWGMSVMADQNGSSNVATAVDVAHTAMRIVGKPRTFDADHIARHDPARVLAECEAKRRIVERHKEVLIERLDDEFPGDSCDALCEVDNDDFPCATLRLLALPYANHPDYREEWRV